MNDHYDDYVAEQPVSFCPDCEARIMADEQMFDQEECFECGGTDCYEIPA